MYYLLHSVFLLLLFHFLENFINSTYQYFYWTFNNSCHLFNLQEHFVGLLVFLLPSTFHFFISTILSHLSDVVILVLLTFFFFSVCATLVCYKLLHSLCSPCFNLEAFLWCNNIGLSVGFKRHQKVAWKSCVHGSLVGGLHCGLMRWKAELSLRDTHHRQVLGCGGFFSGIFSDFSREESSRLLIL